MPKSLTRRHSDGCKKRKLRRQEVQISYAPLRREQAIAAQSISIGRPVSTAHPKSPNTVASRSSSCRTHLFVVLKLPIPDSAYLLSHLSPSLTMTLFYQINYYFLDLGNIKTS